MTDLGTKQDEDVEEKPHRNRWERLWRDPLVFGLAIFVVLLMITAITFGVLSAVNYNEATAAQNDRDANAAKISKIEYRYELLEQEVERYEPFYDMADELTARERILADSEAKAERENAAASTDLATREAAVAARESAAQANAEPWIARVRECLARPGAYKSASVTTGFSGIDFTCYTS